MYRINEVIPALINRVGFRQPTRADYAGVYDPANIESKSGRYFDDGHAVVTVENIREVAITEPNISKEDFNAYIVDLKKAVITTVLDAVFSEPQLIEQNLEFDTCDNLPVLIPNAGKFVGRQIRIASDAGKSVTVNAVTLYFNGPKTFKLYLFNSVKKAPIKELEVMCEADNQVIVKPENWVLNYLDSNLKSGAFYLGYFQDDLEGVMAYDEQPSRWNCGKIYGSSCVEAARVQNAVDFQRFRPQTGSRTFGLNVEYSSSLDFTEKILRNPSVFDTAITLEMAAVVVDKMIHTLRSNGTQRIGAEAAKMLYTELHADSPTEGLPISDGLRKRLRREIAKIHTNFFPKKKATSTQIPKPCSIRSSNQWG